MRYGALYLHLFVNKVELEKREKTLVCALKCVKIILKVVTNFSKLIYIMSGNRTVIQNDTQNSKIDVNVKKSRKTDGDDDDTVTG